MDWLGESSEHSTSKPVATHVTGSLVLLGAAAGCGTTGATRLLLLQLQELKCLARLPMSKPRGFTETANGAFAHCCALVPPCRCRHCCCILMALAA